LFDFGGQLVEDEGDGDRLRGKQGEREAVLAGAEEKGIPGDGGVEEKFPGKDFAQLADDLGAGGDVRLDHGGEDAKDADGRFLGAEFRQEMEDLGQGAESEGFREFRDEDAVGVPEDVPGDAVGAAGGIDEDQVEPRAEVAEGVEDGSDACPAGRWVGGQGGGFEPGVRAGREEGQAGNAGVKDQGGGILPEQGVEESAVLEAAFHQGQSDGPLGIGVREKDAPAAPGQGVGEVDGDGGFPDPALLAGDADLGHWTFTITAGPPKMQPPVETVSGNAPLRHRMLPGR